MKVSIPATLRLVILLAGGAKPTQDKDIKTAQKLARML